MNVMNIKHYLSAMAALAMLAACSDYDPGMSENAVDLTDAEIETIQEYTANFVERYGEMDPNHTWGFGELADMEEMGTRKSEPTSNLWVKVIKGKLQAKDADGNLRYTYNGVEKTPESGEWQNWNDGHDPHWVAYQPIYEYEGKDVPIAFSRHEGAVVIPGFPVQNYYLSDQYNTEPDEDPTKPVRYQETGTPEKHQGQYHIKFPNHEGEFWFDSEEAILKYMRDNQINETEIIPLGDVANFNTLTDAEVADVYAVFSEEWDGTNPAIDLKSYYVQQIWKGTAKYPYTNQDGSTGTQLGSAHMDYLVAYGADYNAGDSEHFYNFNFSNIANGDKSMMLVYDSSTKNFAYKNSLQEESVESAIRWNHYRLVELHGNYYVGFDFDTKGENDKNIPGDHIYNDWIVKIIPGEGTIGQPKDRVRSIKRRVMCEDLGSTFDFDFNDLVFDVEYTREEKYENGVWVPKNTNGMWDATITLQASGGTLPVFIKNFDGTTYNVHEYMGGIKSGDIYSPINVGTGLSLPAKALPTKSVSSTDPDEIVILVTSPDKENRATHTLELPSIEGSKNFGTNNAPQKICVPVTTRWTKEYQQIETAYPYFHEWVNRETGDFGFEEPNDWTKKDINTSKLY